MSIFHVHARFWRLHLLSFCALWGLLASGVANAGQAPAPSEQAEEEKRTTDTPVIIVTAASVDRLLADADFVFEAVERKELSDLVGGLMANVRDLKGMNRTQPFGAMVFLTPGLVPQPVPVGFVPVQDMGELIQTVSLGPSPLKKVAGQDDRYELTERGGNLQIVLKEGYAFIARNAEDLDRTFPDPVALTRTLTSKYDIAASVNLKSVSETTRTVFLELLRAQLGAQLQQRDGESDAGYRVRKANGERMLESIELILTEGESLTIGAGLATEDRSAAIEIRLDATPDSEFAKRMQDLGAKRSHFASLRDEQVPMTFSASWIVDESAKKTLTELMNLGEEQLGSSLAKEPGLKVPVKNLFESLRATVDGGHADFFAQFTGKSSEGFVLVGGARISYANTLSSAVAPLLQHAAQLPNPPKISLNATSHNGISFHRIEPKQVGGGERRLYGGTPTIYVGVGPKAVWFAVGGGQVLPTLKKAIDTVAAGPKSVADRNPSAPFQFVLRMKKWLGLGRNPNSTRPRIADNAFTEENDTLQIDIRPTDTGMRLRAQFDEGFLKLIGLAIAGRIDRSQRL